MQPVSDLVLQLLGWDDGKEAVVYQLRDASWDSGSVWESLATGNFEVANGLAGCYGGRQGLL